MSPVNGHRQRYAASRRTAAGWISLKLENGSFSRLMAKVVLRVDSSRINPPRETVMDSPMPPLETVSL